MKVLKRGAASIGLALVLAWGPHERLSAATCPSECRREFAEVMCGMIEIEEGGTRSVMRYYWSSGIR